jgi:hypothetical protein
VTHDNIPIIAGGAIHRGAPNGDDVRDVYVPAQAIHTQGEDAGVRGLGAKCTARVDRDYALLLHNLALKPGTYRPDPTIMVEFDLWTFNSKVFPAIDPTVARAGERVRAVAPGSYGDRRRRPDARHRVRRAARRLGVSLLHVEP